VHLIIASNEPIRVSKLSTKNTL